MGKPPIPKEILTLEKGKLYGDQAARVAEEPKPLDPMPPERPQHFGEEELAVWDHYAAILNNYGLFQAANTMNLEMLAVNIVKWRKLLNKLRKSDVVVTSASGWTGINPLFSAKNTLEKEIRADLIALGLSSQGLAKLGALSARGKKKDKIEELMD